MIRDGINSYLECKLNVASLTDKLISHDHYENNYNKIMFKRSQGIYFATLLKSVLLYNFPGDSESAANKFTETSWPWAKYLSLDNFIDLLKEALTLWESVYKLVSEVTGKAKIDHVNIAFSNAEYLLKSRINELGLVDLF